MSMPRTQPSEMGTGVGHGPERASSAAAGAKKPCLWHRMLENDGTYVVQVVDGRATVSRLETTGPQPFGTDSVQEHSDR